MTRKIRPLSHHNVSLVITINPTTLFSRALPILISTLRSKRVKVFRLQAPLTLQEACPTIRSLNLQEPPHPLPLRSLRASVLHQQGLIRQMRVVSQVTTMNSLRRLLIFSGRQCFTTFSSTRRHSLSKFTILRMVSNLNVTIRVITMGLIIRRMDHRNLTHRLVMIHHVRLTSRRQATSRLNPHRLLILNGGIRRIKNSLIILIPRRKVSMRISHQVNASHHRQVTRNLRVQTMSLRIPRPFRRAMCTITKHDRQISQVNQSHRHHHINRRQVSRRIRRQVLLNRIRRSRQVRFTRNHQVSLGRPSFTHHAHLANLRLQFHLRTTHHRPNFLTLLLLRRPNHHFLLTPNHCLIRLLLFLLNNNHLFLNLNSLHHLFRRHLTLNGNRHVHDVNRQVNEHHTTREVNKDESVQHIREQQHSVR